MKTQKESDESLTHAQQWARATIEASMTERRALQTAEVAQQAKAEYRTARESWKLAKKAARKAAKDARRAQKELQVLRESRKLQWKKESRSKTAARKTKRT